MSDDYYSRLLPYIMECSRDFLTLRGIDNITVALILDGVFRRLTGFSPLDAAGINLKGGEA